MASHRVLIWWGYAVEWLLSGLLLTLTCILFEITSIENFIRLVAIDVATLFCVIIFGGSLAFLWTFYSKADTDFYQWLDERNGLSVYSKATAYVAAVSGASTLILVAAKYVQVDWLVLPSMFLFFLTSINAYTLVQNVLGLMRLNAHFNLVRRDKMS